MIYVLCQLRYVHVEKLTLSIELLFFLEEDENKNKVMKCLSFSIRRSTQLEKHRDQCPKIFSRSLYEQTHPLQNYGSI